MGLLLSSGCAIDKGTALAADFDADWAGTPDVTKIDTTRNNTLPFAGSASGTLILRDGTPADRVSALANDLRRYVAEHRNVTGRITAGAVSFTVVADRRRADEALSLWRSLTTDDRTLTGDLHDAPTKGVVRWRIELTATDAAAAMTLFEDLVTDGGRHRPLSDVVSLKVGTGRTARPALSVGTDFNGARPTEAIAAYQAVAARYAVAAASLMPDRAAIVVAKQADLARASELAGKAAPGLGATLKVTSADNP
ncbi:hypothetical protein AB0C28_04810 [Nonomuraea sp. NPDC048892]|uniref:hypothetical protein n=1 Tax=Nonomuraea sp. NPDC048892 TaxID=3154624 RepID=UPI000A590EE6